MNPNFETWLDQRELDPRTVQTYKSDAKRIEKEYGDLDGLYDEDKLIGVLRDLEYSRDDEHRNQPNPSKIVVDAKDGSPYKALASYRTALRRYCDFRQSMTETWDYFLEEARRRFEDGTLDQEESYKEEHLGPAVSLARRAFLANEDSWPELLKAAITHNKNNVIDPRSYVASNESNQARIVRWIEADQTGVRNALMELWSEDDRSPGDRVRAFNAKLPTDVFGEGRKSPRLDVVSYLLMGLDISRFPPCRIKKFRDVRMRLQYPEPQADDLGGEYDNALQLLDDVLVEAAKRNMDRPASRLDAQSVVWSLSDLSQPQSAVSKHVVDSPSPAHTTQPTVLEGALNTILYGPPGTGKTYATVRRSVSICDGQTPKDIEQLRARHGELMNEGRIEFVTFHQSFGYEEFVEGIRPKTVGGQIEYRIEDGILKRLADRAAQAFRSDEQREPVAQERLPAFDLVWGRLEASATRTVRTKNGTEYELVPAPDKVELRRGHRPSYSYGKEAVRRIWDLRHGLGHPNSVGPNRVAAALGRKTHGTSPWAIYNELWKLAHSEGSISSASHTANGPNFVLVIDEINRANVSKVMGELITLLEEDKREGAENEVTVTLPYSREAFTLPKNLHILGTMNTADRSIALLDTALRRRFRFEEMSPKPELLKDAAKRTEVDLPSVVAAMNERLEYLVDRDHLIGHAWFMDTNDRPDVDAVMRHKVIPLIAEYFYDDWHKVQAVLGDTDDFVKGEPISPPPGLDSTQGEERYRWAVQETFAEDAYERLTAGRPRDAGE